MRTLASTAILLTLAACGGGDSGKCGAFSPDGCWTNERAAAERQLERERMAAEAEARKAEAEAKAKEAEADRAERQAQRDAEVRKAEAEAAARKAEADADRAERQAEANADRLAAQQEQTTQLTEAEAAHRKHLETYWDIAGWGPWNTALVELIPTAAEAVNDYRLRGNPAYVTAAPVLSKSATWDGTFIKHVINPAVRLTNPRIQFRYDLQTKLMDAGIRYAGTGELDKWHDLLGPRREASLAEQGLRHQWYAISGHVTPPIAQSFIMGEVRTSNIIGTFRTANGVTLSTPDDE